MSVVPISYDIAREMENFKKSLFFDDFRYDPFLPLDVFHRVNTVLPLSLFHPYFLNYPFPFPHLHDFHQMASFNVPKFEKEKLTIDTNGFQLTFDIKEFKPSELNVSTVNNYVIVEGKHEDRKDDKNFTKKYFSRTYLLPNGYNPEEVDSTISSDGILTVKIPPPPPPRAPIECRQRRVQIKEIGTTF